MKYKQTTKILDKRLAIEADHDKFLEDGSALWKNWKGDGDSMLIL